MDQSVHKIYQPLPLQDPPKFTQSWIFCLKTNHLATLVTRLGEFTPIGQLFSLGYFV
jgi:hypothetical protein